MKRRVNGYITFYPCIICVVNQNMCVCEATPKVKLRIPWEPNQIYCFVINPYSAKGLGDWLYRTLRKLPGEVGYSFCLFLKF